MLKSNPGLARVLIPLDSTVRSQLVELFDRDEDGTVCTTRKRIEDLVGKLRRQGDESSTAEAPPNAVPARVEAAVGQIRGGAGQPSLFPRSKPGNVRLPGILFPGGPESVAKGRWYVSEVILVYLNSVQDPAERDAMAQAIAESAMSHRQAGRAVTTVALELD